MSNRMARVAPAGQQGELWRIYALVSRKGQCGVLSLSSNFGLSGGKIRRHGSPLNAYLISGTIQQCWKTGDIFSPVFAIVFIVRQETKT